VSEARAGYLGRGLASLGACAAAGGIVWAAPSGLAVICAAFIVVYGLRAIWVGV
jgi:hypothetical protein